MFGFHRLQNEFDSSTHMDQLQKYAIEYVNVSLVKIMYKTCGRSKTKIDLDDSSSPLASSSVVESLCAKNMLQHILSLIHI